MSAAFSPGGPMTSCVPRVLSQAPAGHALSLPSTPQLLASTPVPPAPAASIRQFSRWARARSRLWGNDGTLPLALARGSHSLRQQQGSTSLPLGWPGRLQDTLLHVAPPAAHQADAAAQSWRPPSVSGSDAPPVPSETWKWRSSPASGGQGHALLRPGLPRVPDLEVLGGARWPAGPALPQPLRRLACRARGTSVRSRAPVRGVCGGRAARARPTGMVAGTGPRSALPPRPHVGPPARASRGPSGFARRRGCRGRSVAHRPVSWALLSCPFSCAGRGVCPSSSGVRAGGPLVFQLGFNCTYKLTWKERFWYHV